MSSTVHVQPAGLLALVDELTVLRKENADLRAGRSKWPSKPASLLLLDPHL